MEKIKVDIVAETTAADEEDVYIGSTKIKVATWIPYEKKIALAEEFAGMAVLFSEETGLFRVTPFTAPIKTYLMLKYYTNVDVEDYSLAETYDFLTRWYGTALFMSTIGADAKDAFEMAEAMANEIVENDRYTHSLDYNLMKSFGSVLSGEDISETFAKAQEVNEDMIKMVGLLADAKKKRDRAPEGVLDFTKRN